MIIIRYDWVGSLLFILQREMQSSNLTQTANASVYRWNDTCTHLTENRNLISTKHVLW